MQKIIQKINLNKLFQFFSYYILLLLGLIGTSWIIWARFIRTRTIREIPDYLLTEYRFWILLYICCIYLYVIKNLLKPTEANSILTFLNDYIYKPFTILDRAIKYNKLIKPYYKKFIILFTKTVKHWEEYIIFWFIIFIRIVPRFILVTFLLLDTFYFHKLEIFYKVILIGTLPFIYRYIKYSVKDMYEYYVEELENTYDEVTIFEKEYKYDLSRKRETEAIHHYSTVSLKEYIEIKFDNWVLYILNDVTYEYIADPFAKVHIYKEYKMNKYNNLHTKLTYEDAQEIDKLFNELMPLIIDLKLVVLKIRTQEEKSIIKWSKIIIFSLYLICWGFILTISYYHYPIELPMFKYLVRNIMTYLSIINDPFAAMGEYSRNTNLITIESVQTLINNLIKQILK